ncbi:MAG: hypothetical protein ABFR75_10400 [Acidobacteriota bacterium]
MPFSIKMFIEKIFAPAKNEVLTIMIDVPHGSISDTGEWKERREMARDWHSKISKLSSVWGMEINPLVIYKATGGHNSDLPEKCFTGDREVITAEIIKGSTIILSMPEYSATAPLYEYSRSLKRLRVGSMPGAAKFMEETGLSADYMEISKRCKVLVEIMEKAKGAEVTFSSGHKCYFDISVNGSFIDDGILHPQMGGTDLSTSNLPAGEVYCVPDEKQGSRTEGELPFQVDGETGLFRVRENRITEIEGEGDSIAELREKMNRDEAWRNIAEFAIGVNEKATVTGNVLQDEKAGFHWAYGRSDHLGGITGVDKFLSPDNVVHTDIVYAKGNPIECSLLKLIFPDNTEKILIEDGKLIELSE